MPKEAIDLVDVAKGATDLANAILGVSKFVDEHVSSTAVTLEEINSLSGLIAGMLALANKHSNEVTEFEQENG